MADKDVQLTVGLVVDKAIKGFESLGNASYNAGTKLQKLGSRLDNTFGSAFRTITKGAALVTAAIGGVTAAAMTMGGEFERQMELVAGVSSATADELQKMSDKAQDIGRNLPLTAQDAAGAMYNLASAGMEVVEIMDAINPATDLAVAQQHDLTEAAETLVATLRGFQMDASESTRVVDVFNNAISNSMLTLDKIAHSITYVAPMAQSLGLNIEETAAAMELLANTGMEGSRVGISLRRTFAALVEPTVKAQNTLDRLGVTVYDVNGKMRDLGDIFMDLRDAGMTAADAVKIFDQRGAVGAITLAEMSGELERLEDELKQTGLTQELVDRQMNSFIGRLIKLKSAVQSAGISVFDQLKESAKGVLDTLTEFVKASEVWIKDTGIITESIKAFFEGISGGLPSLEDFKRTLNKIDADAIAKGFKAFGEAIKTVFGALKDLASLVPWQKIIDNADAITKAIVIGWAADKITNIAAAWLLLADSLATFSKTILGSAVLKKIFTLWFVKKASTTALAKPLAGASVGSIKTAASKQLLKSLGAKGIAGMSIFGGIADILLNPDELGDELDLKMQWWEERAKQWADSVIPDIPDEEIEEFKRKKEELLHLYDDARETAPETQSVSVLQTLQSTLVDFVQTVSAMQQQAVDAVKTFGVPAQVASEQFHDVVVENATNAADELVEQFENPQMAGIFYSALEKLGKEGGNKLFEALGKELMKVEDKVKEVTKSIEQMTAEKQQKFGNWGDEWTSTVIREDSQSKVVQFTNGIVYSYETIAKAQDKLAGNNFNWTQALDMDGLDSKIKSGLNNLVPVASDVGNSMGKGIHDNLITWGDKAVDAVQKKLNSLKVPSLSGTSTGAVDVTAVARAEG